MEKPRLGKLSLDELRSLVLKHLPLAASIGLDANEVKLDGSAIVVSHDPALGVPLEALGFFAFHYVAADQLSKRAIPIYAVLGMYFPPSSRDSEIEATARSFGAEASKYGVSVVAGHTGRYEGVSLPIISVTMIGSRIAPVSPPKPGDKVLLSGVLGLEAAWLMSVADPSKPKIDFRMLTPVPLLLEVVRAEEVKLAHDVGEGGLASSLLEIAQTYNVGFNISKEPEAANGLPLEEAIYAPSFGCAVLIVERGRAICLAESLTSKGYAVREIGEVTGPGRVKILEWEVREFRRSRYDEYYGQQVQDGEASGKNIHTTL